MSTVLLRDKLTPQQKNILRNEFPQYQFLEEGELPPIWSKVEILYGSRLDSKELAQANNLRWIHIPQGELRHVCLKDLEQFEQIVISLTRGENLDQIAEYTLGITLAFAKSLFEWRQSPQTPKEAPWRLADCTLLQVGLGKIGTKLTETFSHFGSRCWGVDARASFHPHCQRVYTFQEMHSLLPSVDIASLSIGRSRGVKFLFSKHELDLMKEGSILIVLRNMDTIDCRALIDYLDKFRAVIIDSADINSLSSKFQRDNVFLSPGISERPLDREGLAFTSFRKNLRHFTHRTQQEMCNLVSRPYLGYRD